MKPSSSTAARAMLRSLPLSDPGAARAVRERPGRLRAEQPIERGPRRPRHPDRPGERRAAAPADGIGVRNRPAPAARARHHNVGGRRPACHRGQRGRPPARSPVIGCLPQCTAARRCTAFDRRPLSGCGRPPARFRPGRAKKFDALTTPYRPIDAAPPTCENGTRRPRKRGRPAARSRSPSARLHPSAYQRVVKLSGAPGP